MSPLHILFAIIATALWGSNFVVIKLAFEGIPPLLFLTLRFILCAFPLVFFLKRPNVSFSYLLSLSLFLWILQFSMLFLGVYWGLSPGLAAVVMQMQALFTVLWSIMFFGFRPSIGQIAGLAIATLGIGIIAFENASSCLLPALFLVLGGAFSLSIGNLLLKKAGKVDALALMVWSSIIPPIPLFLMSLLWEGWSAIYASLTQLSIPGISAICYTAIASTLIATSLWAYLIRVYQPAIVTPMALLIPAFGMGLSVIILEESFSFTIWAACGLIIGGLILQQSGALYPQTRRAWRRLFSKARELSLSPSPPQQ